MDHEYELYHHGVKGMKWGRRKKSNVSSGRVNNKHSSKNERSYRTKEILKKSAITNGKRLALGMLVAEGAVSAVLYASNPAYPIAVQLVDKMVMGALGSMVAGSLMATTAEVAIDAAATYKHNKSISSSGRR